MECDQGCKFADLAGYRNGPVYIRRSLHVQPSRDAVRDMMPLLFVLLTDETNPGVRVVVEGKAGPEVPKE